MKLAIAFALLVCLIAAVAGHEEENFMKWLKCKDEDANVDKVKLAWKECKSESKAAKSESADGEDEDDQKTKHKHFLKQKVCMWKKLEVVVDNVWHGEKFNETIMYMYPKGMGIKLKEASAVCQSEKKTKDLSEDDNCSSYRPLVKCLMKKMYQTCHEDEEDEE